MVWLPAVSVLVEKVATPPVRFTVPRVVVLPLMVSVNVTDPVGVAPPDTVGRTVAVNVTDWFGADGLTEVVSVVELLLRISCVAVALLLVSKVVPAAGLNWANTLCVPNGRVLVLNVAVP